jgi:hypothetical protein
MSTITKIGIVTALALADVRAEPLGEFKVKIERLKSTPAGTTELVAQGPPQRGRSPVGSAYSQHSLQMSRMTSSAQTRWCRRTSLG